MNIYFPQLEGGVTSMLNPSRLQRLTCRGPTLLFSSAVLCSQDIRVTVSQLKLPSGN